MKSVMPEIRGTTDFYCGAYPHPKSLPRTSSRRSSFFAADGRAETVSSILRHADTVAHHFNAICGEGGGVCRGPRTTTSFGSQRELPLARLVIHRKTSARTQRKETLSVQPRSGMLALFFTIQRLAADNNRAPHIWRAPRGGCCLGGRPLRSCPSGFGPGTTRP